MSGALLSGIKNPTTGELGVRISGCFTVPLSIPTLGGLGGPLFSGLIKLSFIFIYFFVTLYPLLCRAPRAPGLVGLPHSMRKWSDSKESSRDALNAVPDSIFRDQRWGRVHGTWTLWADTPRKAHLHQGQTEFSPSGSGWTAPWGLPLTPPLSSLGSPLVHTGSHCPSVPGGDRGGVSVENKHKNRSDPDHRAQLPERKITWTVCEK